MISKDTIVTNRGQLSIPCEKLEDLASELALIKEAYYWVNDPANGALGLAAPQVGSIFRWFVMKNPSDQIIANSVIAVVNPKMELVGKPTTKVEACFSNPGEHNAIIRWPHVDVTFSELDVESGVLTKRKLRFNGRSAQIFQHEHAHLRGKCIFDKRND